MKQNIIALGLIASAGLTFCHVPKANAWNFRPSNETTIEESQILAKDGKCPYTGNDEDGECTTVNTDK
ncbi:MAG: hypothetical protein F6K22_03975 [Okeania sp. SIO2F4]|uniref:hypothetical protein n=1 Tax=Okeania sp. SIO2F4 TaxID=2607790 RepID=UPI00142C78C4|nr:hypothetical protein [Okeania sp. SIO2F4]NES02061.1 hypothetical protein [Okeania sp. SIO2F4]